MELPAKFIYDLIFGRQNHNVLFALQIVEKRFCFHVLHMSCLPDKKYAAAACNV